MGSLRSWQTESRDKEKVFRVGECCFWFIFWFLPGLICSPNILKWHPSSALLLRLLRETHRLDESDRTQLRIVPPPHSPVLVLALLQQVLVTSEPLLLVAHPAAVGERQKEGIRTGNRFVLQSFSTDGRRHTHIPPCTFMDPTLYMKAVCCWSSLVMKSLMLLQMVLDFPVK